MNKRIVCVLLTLVMLMGLVCLPASAAGLGTSESAITVLKQLEGYSTRCDANGYIGYGTKCTEQGAHGNHTTTEKLADKALRKALAELDTAINSFATKKNVALTQCQHDALVLFSFENGTAWTTGTGDLQAAVTSRATGSTFLNAICRWDESTADDDRRMVEANMYLNGAYSPNRPSSLIRVYFNPNYEKYTLETFEGSINGNTEYQYYDVSANPAPHLVPTMDYHTFTGWYMKNNYGWSKCSALNASCHNKTLVAGWVPNYSEPGDTSVSYVISASELTSQKVYRRDAETGAFGALLYKEAKDYYFMDGKLMISADYLAEDGTRWCRIDGTSYWVKVKLDGAPSNIDLTVTVTNSYVRSRKEASIHSPQNGTYHQGAQLRIIATAEKDNFLWGQVAKSAKDATPVGWVALMYTNYNSLRNNNSTNDNTKTLGTAVITYNGYVNVRSDAGTNNKIVSALPYGTQVEIFETKFVNGLEWARCSTGWFCLSYAEVTRTNGASVNHANDSAFTSYAFTGTVDPSSVEIYEEPSVTANRVYTRQYINPSVTVSNLVYADGMTWGKISEGWVRVTDSYGNSVDVTLDVSEFKVIADSLAVRTSPDTASERVDLLSNGVAFNVNGTYQVMVIGDTIWGYADKVGETNSSYHGWVNLATKNVSRSNAPKLPLDSNGNVIPDATGLMATVINTNSLRVRSSDSASSTQIGTLSRGTTVKVWEANEKKTWYHVDSNKNGVYDLEKDGWVSAHYVSVAEASTSGSTGSTGTGTGTAVETGMGIVANTYSGVNVRQGAGTAYAPVGKLLPGTAVEILEVKTVGASKWGRVTQGWICMDYVTMISKYPITGSGTTGTAGSASGSTTVGAEVAIYTGFANGELYIHKEASTASDVVRTLQAGDPITMHELLTVVEYEDKETNDSNAGSTTTVEKKTTYWARVNDGYIYAPGDNIVLDTVDEHIYTVTEADTLNLRSNPDTESAVVYKLAKGAKVTITELEIHNASVWGKAECTGDKGELLSGWVSLAYMTKGSVTVNTGTTGGTTTGGVIGGNTTGTITGNTTTGGTTTGGTTNPSMGNTSSQGGFVTNPNGYRYTGKVINTDSLNVRSTPSTAASKTTTLSRGQALVIYETTIAENMAWGRCDAGWVYLYYVDLVPVTGGVDARVVYTENAVIYTDMNCSSIAGTYAKMSVIDIFEIVGTMARTELGWVSTNDLL